METLTIKELALYLPYGLKCWVKDYPLEIGSIPANQIYQMHSVYFDGTCTFHDLVESQQGFKDIKPLLRPLSDLTREIEVNGKKLIPIDYLYSMNSKVLNWDDTFLVKRVVDALNRDVVSGKLPSYYMDKLHEWHFDTENLIGRGLAINLNTIK